MKCKRADCPKSLPEDRNRKRIYCSRRCKNLATRDLYNRLNLRDPLCGTLVSATRGAIGELRVSVDLMVRGYEVFRALSPACSCDIAVLKDGKLLRIECRTGVYRKDGTYYVSRTRFRADVLAVILHDSNHL